MRTTLTLDADVAADLKRRARKTGKPFRQVLNDAVRAGLRAQDAPPPRPYRLKPISAGGPLPGINLDKALLVPEAAVHGYDGRKGRVWTVESGRLQQRVVKFRHRTEDSRLEIVDGLPEGVSVIARRDDGLREGRSARIIEVKAK